MLLLENFLRLCYHILQKVMKLKKYVLKKYAKLIAKVGANVQQGQPVCIYAQADQHDFAALIAEECYRLGASLVQMEWSYQPITKMAYDYESLETLSNVPKWKIEKLKWMATEYPCRIVLLSEDPDGLKGVDVEKMQTASIAVGKRTKRYRDAIESKHQWTIASVPSVKWAKKVFPDVSENEAMELLWKAILKTVRVSEDPQNDPVEEWNNHNENFKKRCQWLNEQQFDSLSYYSANGTDFWVGLIPQGQWCGGGETTKQGVYFNPNLPTEEIFTSPMAGKAEGKLVATKPLSYHGQLIEDFWIRFEDGKAVEWDAKEGKELLTRMIEADKGSCMLGECALVPKESPINQSGLLFYETLFDENACCHVALGMGFNDCIKGYLDMEDPNKECRALGVNDSMIHVDFMIGSDDLSIIGHKDGKDIPIFKDGHWA